MRWIAAVVMSCVTLAAARPAAADDSSKSMQRAKQLVDKGDYLSATIELKKVLDGETGDSEGTKNLALFLMARSLFELKYYAAAAAFLDRTLQQDVSAFKASAYNYVIKIVDKSSPIGVMNLLQTAKAPFLSSTDLTPDTKEALTYQMGVHAVRNMQFDEGRALLEQVPRRSKYASAAQLRIAESYYRQDKQALGLAATIEAAKDSDVAWRAVRDLIFYARFAVDNGTSDPIAVKRTLTTLAEDSSPAGGLAQLELSYVAAIESRRLNPLVVDGDTFAALVVTSRCLQGPTSDALPRLAAFAANAKSTIQGLIADDENEATFARVTKYLDDGPKDADAAFVAMVLGSETVREYVEYARDLKRQLRRLSDEDRAWQTTQIAAEVLQELTLQQALADADAGKIYRTTLTRAAKGLDTLIRDEKRAQLDGAKPISIGEKAGADLVVAPRLCGGIPGAAKTAAVAGPTAAGDGKKGCGGCATDRGSSMLLLLALIPLFGRRRDTRRCLARGR